MQCVHVRERFLLLFEPHEFRLFQGHTLRVTTEHELAIMFSVLKLIHGNVSRSILFGTMSVLSSGSSC